MGWLQYPSIFSAVTLSLYMVFCTLKLDLVNAFPAQRQGSGSLLEGDEDN
jgi:hypothetical protein